MAIDQARHLKVSCVNLKLQKRLKLSLPFHENDAWLNLNTIESFGRLKIKVLVKVVAFRVITL